MAESVGTEEEAEVDTSLEPPLPAIPDGAVMVTVKIARFNPDQPDAFAETGGWQSFRVPCLPSDRMLNLLIYIKSYLDGTLTFRRSCAHGVCGSDAMRINGVNRLACKVLMRDLLPKSRPGKRQKTLTITVEPIRGLPVDFNPEAPDDAGFQSFQVPCLPTDRLLNLLHYVKWYLDGTLTFRRSCAHGVCGSDAMRINGVNRLACKVLMRDMLPKKPGKQLTITIEPIRGLPVEKDLVVDMEPFFDAFRAVKPFLITSGNEPTRERIQSQTDRALRRHHQVHPVRVLHDQLPGVLE